MDIIGNCYNDICNTYQFDGSFSYNYSNLLSIILTTYINDWRPGSNPTTHRKTQIPSSKLARPAHLSRPSSFSSHHSNLSASSHAMLWFFILISSHDTSTTSTIQLISIDQAVSNLLFFGVLFFFWPSPFYYVFFISILRLQVPMIDLSHKLLSSKHYFRFPLIILLYLILEFTISMLRAPWSVILIYSSMYMLVCSAFIFCF